MPLLSLPASFPIARYQFLFEVEEDLYLPPYSGSTLRGIFGHALKRVACMTKMSDCIECPLISTCPYAEIFEPPSEQLATPKLKNLPTSYIIEPPEIGERVFKKGEFFTFEMVILGKTLSRIALINFAFQKALSRGVNRGGKAQFIDMKVETKNGFESILEGQYIRPHEQNIPVLETKGNCDICIEIKTPLRLQCNGHALAPNNITSEVFFTQLIRRLLLISQLYFQQPLDLNYAELKLIASQLKNEKDLTWYDWVRYSNRQQSKMHLGGVVGKWKFYDLPTEFQQLLYLGQWLHAGKNTAFGLGKYVINQI